MYVDLPEDDDIAAIDTALLKLRRFLQTPATIRDGDRTIETSTLLVIGATAARTDGATVGQIAHALDVAPSTASRLVTRAEATGMITRAAASGDARQARLHLTADGTALHQRALAFRYTRLRQATTSLSPRQRRQFARLLSLFADAVKDAPEDIGNGDAATHTESI